ncbi:HDOD domain-containing protein [Idiomarina abyssalis]|jgi:EAL and modified HD-GYP domain-containing signal transduction protein|uniref:HDOD domain-containing protein n=3 Tax=Idiomarina TaxID=135575 RepID=A0A8I1G9S8_9GAMM|nr:HDOD domain-containing protein [Idiomarina abyssalis]MBJ7265934.1 HDOD domain-containing protein [Idiomarina abyssalis]MBJ7273498.1 HDOD domain-containing protein [Idiomarina abyssalis]MBJ7314516.1 HDOD domain-containing protein [Idiomarina abyssalis]
MSYSYIARQPILTRDQKVYGYELLFRDSNSNSFPNIDPNEATSKLLLEQHLLGDIQTLCMGKQAFINFHARTLLNDFPSFLNARTVWVELLETVGVDAPLLEACSSTTSKGYRIALDDHDFDGQWDPVIPMINMVKVDIQEQGLNLESKIRFFKEKGIPLLAERVETYDEFERCLELGFDYFQGFFFEKPQVVQQKSLSPNRISKLTLLSEVHKKELDLNTIRQIIEQDLSLTYSLLKLVNSALYGGRKKIENIQHALVYLGDAEIRRFVTLVVLANVSAGQPEELTIKSVTRARFMELVTVEILNEKHRSSAFLAGMLSLLDIILGVSMDDVLKQLPLSSEITKGLKSREGVWGYLLQMTEIYERGEWDALDKHPLKQKLNGTDIGQLYIDASQWCRLALF